MVFMSKINIFNEKIKVAIIGCGRISKNHIKSIFIHNQICELVAICDKDIEKLLEARRIIDNCETESINKLNNIQEFTNDHLLFDAIEKNRLKVDLLVLTTPSGLHPKHTIMGAELGINICTEKPMATSWQDGLKMVEICNEKNVKLFVVKQNRFNKTVSLVKDQIRKKRFGKIGLVVVNVFWQRPQSYYDQDDWRGTLELDGGALMNQASHYVDLLNWMIGPVESINASIATVARDIEAEDTAALKIKWKNGALGTMAVTMITYPQNIEGSITVLGDKGTVKIGGKAVNKIEEWHFSDKSEDDELVQRVSYETSSVYGFGHPAYYENMLNSLRGESEPVCTGEDGLKSLELLIASYRSSKTGLEIQLPLER